jgi:hypothetical protein
MKCKEITNLLAAYAENQVSLEQRQLVERHLDHCIDCRAALLDYRTISERLKSLRSTADLPDMAVINISDAKHVIKDKSFNRVRYALAAIPVIVIVIILAVLQPWVSSSNPQAVLAKAITAVENVKSYRSSHVPGIYIMNQDGTFDYENNSIFQEFDFPDKAHIIYTLNGVNNDYIFIGTKMYYSTSNFTIIFPGIPGNIPTMQDTAEELKRITGLRQISDETIDGVDCYHFIGKDESNPDDVTLWIGKDDYLIRQKIRTNYNTGTVVETSKYYDFNFTITIEAPLDSSGNLLPGWQLREMP